MNSTFNTVWGLHNGGHTNSSFFANQTRMILCTQAYIDFCRVHLRGFPRHQFLLCPVYNLSGNFVPCFEATKPSQWEYSIPWVETQLPFSVSQIYVFISFINFLWKEWYSYSFFTPGWLAFLQFITEKLSIFAWNFRSISNFFLSTLIASRIILI